MTRVRPILLCCLLLALLPAAAPAQQGGGKLVIHHMDQVEVLLENGRWVTHCAGNVVFQTESGWIYCDSAVWRKGESAVLTGHVKIEDTAFLLTADSVYHDVRTDSSEAWGERVEMWSFPDSLFAISTHAVYVKQPQYLFMDDRPTVFLRYPDSANMVEVLADSIEYGGDSSYTTASGNVVISSDEFSSRSGRAVLDNETRQLDLIEKPTATSGYSTVSGEFISVRYREGRIDHILVTDSARGEIRQPVDSAETVFDESLLSGREMVLEFHEGALAQIACYDQAYSWYYPASRDGVEFHENSVSGDTIRFALVNDELSAVRVTGGAIGTYVTGKLTPTLDSLMRTQVDTVEYSAEHIDYSLRDSVISLHLLTTVSSGSMSLKAHDVQFDTGKRIIEARSAALDSLSTEERDAYALDLQPNGVPVTLEDGPEVMYGNYLEYSIDTDKGRIVHSKSENDKGVFYGEKMFREQKRIYYIRDGRFTTCDLECPHWHFRSKDLKVIEGDKMIARPVVAYVGRLPVLIFPYYVFPLKKGRHSGILPFEFGNFERDIRYVKDLGYYWAASEYWDWLGAVDYYDNNRTFTLKSDVRFVKRYVADGKLSAQYTRETSYNSQKAQESKPNRWYVDGHHNHTLSPTLKLATSWKFQSDKTYFQDLSPNLQERLNRVLTSDVNVNKQFGKNTSLSVQAKHTENLDLESRSDDLPIARLTLPPIYPFGDGYRDEDGNLKQKWYHGFILRYSPGLTNRSDRQTKYNVWVDTLPVDSTYIDSTGATVEVHDTLYVKDSTSYRTRKKVLKVTHSPSLQLPQLRLGPYLTVAPSLAYSETWFRILHTDQSEAAGVEAEWYRSRAWSASVRASTNLYGTVYPNVAGLIGLRHVLTPGVAFSYRPDITDHHPAASGYAGVSGGSRKSRSLSVSLGNLLQAKVKKGDGEKNFDFLSVTSGFSYDFEEDDKPYSALSTSVSSNAIPGVTITGNMSHSFYEADTNTLRFWHPALQSYSARAVFTVNLPFPFFDEPSGVPRGADSAAALNKPSGRRGSCRVRFDYTQSENGLHEGTPTKSKTFFANIDIAFSLTSNTSITYTQRYDFESQRTITSSVGIVRNVHCWTGSLQWNPTGPTKGFAFKLYVTKLPEIKIDQGGHDSLLDGIQKNY